MLGKISRGVFILLFLLLLISTSWGFLRTTHNQVVYLPEFGGRVYLENQIHPGTFTVSTDWEEIRTWGKDAVMSIENGSKQPGKGAARLRAWRPDPKTAGVFEYSEKVIAEPVDRLHYCVLHENENGRMIFRQERHSILFFGLATSFACCIYFIGYFGSPTKRSTT